MKNNKTSGGSIRKKLLLPVVSSIALSCITMMPAVSVYADETGSEATAETMDEEPVIEDGADKSFAEEKEDQIPDATEISEKDSEVADPETEVNGKDEVSGSNSDGNNGNNEEPKDNSGTGATNKNDPSSSAKDDPVTKKETEVSSEGWKFESGKWYYYKNNSKYTGWHYMTSAESEKKDHWSYFGKDGALRTGWVRLGKGTSEPDGNSAVHWSYFGDNGWLRTGWVQLGQGTSEPDGNSAKHWSYFGSNGWLRTGWVQLGQGTSEPDGNSAKHWSYFGANGWLTTDWKYFSKADGESTPHWSYFGANGWLMTNSWYTNEQGLHWFDNRGWLATDDPVIDRQLYNDSNSNGVLKKNTSKNGWHKWDGNYYWLVNGVVLKGYTGVTRIDDKGKWYYINDGVTSDVVKDTAVLAQASADENKNYTGGKAGDQTKGEVFFKYWFNRPWHMVIRAKDAAMREKIAYGMERAAQNDHIGYDMNQRNTLYNEASKVGWDPGKVTKNCETDCSALVSTVLRYAGLSANDVRIGSNCLSTHTIKSKLQNTGKFTFFYSEDYISGPEKLIRGDILLLENGHTAVITKSVSDVNKLL